MQLNLETLASLGAFTGAPVPREITWKMAGEEFKGTVYVRPLSFASAVGGIRAGFEGVNPVAQRIADCICDAEGRAIFTAQDVTGEADPERGPLDGALTLALLQAIGEVNELGKKLPQSPTTSSGTNSCSAESAAEPSPKPSSG